MGYNFQFLCMEYEFLMRYLLGFRDVIKFKHIMHTIVWMYVH